MNSVNEEQQVGAGHKAAKLISAAQGTKTARRQQWFAPDEKTARFDASGHVWETSGKTVDIFAYSEGEYHNGPRCTVCGYAACWHCKPDPPKCPARHKASSRMKRGK